MKRGVKQNCQETDKEGVRTPKGGQHREFTP
jgi:hypothetical protein